MNIFMQDCEDGVVLPLTFLAQTAEKVAKLCKAFPAPGLEHL